MLSILNVIIPIFAIIGVGYLAVRLRLYPSDGVKGLVAFVNNFAAPCLLFQGMLHADFSSTFNFSIIVPFYVGSLTSLYGGAWIARRFFGLRPGEAVSVGFAATFANTVLIGIPVLQRAYGTPAMSTVFSIIAFHAPLLITIGMVTMELARRDGAPLHKSLGVAAVRVVLNPLLWGIGLGLAANRFGITLPEPASAFVGLMAAAVAPAALFGLGGALNEYRLQGNWVEAAAMSLLKLIIHPIIAYVLTVHLLHVPIEYARYAVLLAAMPTGINAYVFATYYDRAIDVATNTILISTVFSIATVSAWLYFLSL